MKKTYLLPILMLPLLLCHCQQPNSDYITLDGFAQGSTYHFVVKCADTTGLQAAVDSLFTAVDNSMSVYNEHSLLNRLNRGETDSVDRHIAYCIAESEKLSRLSDGAFDITIKPITEAWGFAGKKQSGDPNIDSLLRYVGYQKIRIQDGRLIKEIPGMQLDLNSVAQGYTADLLGRLMDSRGITNYMVEIGGEIFCRGLNSRGKEWVVGIDKPVEGNFIPGADLQVKLSLSGKGLATSGNYRKFHTDAQGRKITHIINAKTGRSEVSNLLSATVIADNATLADLYGTLMMIIGLERSKDLLTQRPDLMGYLVYTDEEGDFQTYASENLRNHIVD